MGAEWHSGNYEYIRVGGIFNKPMQALEGGGFLTSRDRRDIMLVRHAPLHMNELREIDIMEGWLLPAKATRYDDES